jgi:hypothetical protein
VLRHARTAIGPREFLLAQASHEGRRTYALRRQRRLKLFVTRARIVRAIALLSKGKNGPALVAAAATTGDREIAVEIRLGAADGDGKIFVRP